MNPYLQPFSELGKITALGLFNEIGKIIKKAQIGKFDLVMNLDAK